MYRPYNSGRQLDANESALAEYMAGQDRIYREESGLEQAEEDIRDCFMRHGCCRVQLEINSTLLTWEDFLEEIDEGGLWERLGADRDALFDKFCKDWAPYRLAYTED